MKLPIHLTVACIAIALVCVQPGKAQSSVGNLTGVVVDQDQAAIINATITVRSTETGASRTAATDSAGRYTLINLPTSTYELTIEAPNFSKFVRSGVVLEIGQTAVVNASLTLGKIEEIVIVNDNASALNTTTAEVATRFDTQRLAELPFSSNRNVYGLLLSSSGVSQLANGQTAFAIGISFSANGGRLRSNSFLLDGQDINDPALTGAQIPLNNPDAIQEVRIVTGQFLAEYGYSAGSVTIIAGKSGTNDLHGSLFWFHNNEALNACSNTDKRAGFCGSSTGDEAKPNAPLRRENQFGLTLGGPVMLPRFGKTAPYFYSGRNRTFFFTDYQRWSDRRSPSLTLGSVPTVEGRALLQFHSGQLAHVREFLRLVPAGRPNGSSPGTVTTPNAQFDVPLGEVTATSNFRFDSDQGSFRIDHQANTRNLIYGRYRYSYDHSEGVGQINPPGHGTVEERNAHAAMVAWTSSLSDRASNEARVAWKRFEVVRDSENPLLTGIPAIQINELGLTGDRESERRTAFGLGTNLPIIRASGGYQISDSISLIKAEHSFKFGVELRRIDEKGRFGTPDRGSLVYATLSDFVNDVAQSGSKGQPLPGGDADQFYHWNEFYAYGQDQWKILPNLTLTYGMRYEYPGDSFSYLFNLNQRILAANDNRPAFRFEPPKTDVNNWMPRIGFSWNPAMSKKGIIGFFTGGDKLVIRAGYARAYDPIFINTHNNIFGSFPFTATQSFSGSNAFLNLVNTVTPDLSNPGRFTRLIVPSTFRAPAVDQFAVDVQRELGSDLILRLGYVRTRGTGLFQTADANPRMPCLFGTGPNTCNTTGIDRITGRPLSTAAPILSQRIDASREVVTGRKNSASSVYDALHISLEKRLSRGFSFGVHYTRSTLIDTASDVINLSVAEIALAQDPFDLAAEKGRSGFDRPQRLSGNVVFELPFFAKQKGIVGLVLGGWQLNAFLNFQSGAPFSPLNGLDPTGSASAGLRPNLFSGLDVSRMNIALLYEIERRLRAEAFGRALQIFQNLPAQVPCSAVAGWLPEPLPLTIFSAPRGRVTCDGNLRNLVIDHIGVLEGQRIGSAGRNILRSDSLKLVDIGVIKNTQLTGKIRAQIWIDAFNAFNSRNFGIPSGIVTSVGFLDQWATDGGSRRIRFGARLAF